METRIKSYIYIGPNRIQDGLKSGRVIETASRFGASRSFKKNTLALSSCLSA